MREIFPLFFAVVVFVFVVFVVVVVFVFVFVVFVFVFVSNHVNFKNIQPASNNHMLLMFDPPICIIHLNP